MRTNMTPEERIILSKIGRQGGQAKSEKKTKANRENALKRWAIHRSKQLPASKEVE